jgi:hypothetical protein
VFVWYEMVELVKAAGFTEYCPEIPGGIVDIQQRAVLNFWDYLRRHVSPQKTYVSVAKE